MKVLIVGAGAHGRVVLDILRHADGYESVAFLDDNERLWGQQINGAEVLGGLDLFLDKAPGSFRFVVAVGKPEARLSIVHRIQQRSHLLLNAIHPTAVVEATASLGEGNVVCAMAVITSNASIGHAVLVNSGAIVEHDCLVEDGVTISAGACLAGRAAVRCGAFVCAGALILPRVTIGAGAIVGAGAVVMEDVPERMLAVGYPARVVKRVDPTFDWGAVL